MEISPDLMSSSPAQMQARIDAAQNARVLNQIQADAGKAQNATHGAKTPAEKEVAMKRLVKVSQDFESIFLGYMLKTMRGTVPKSDFFGDKKEEDIFGSMRDEEMAKGMAKAGGIGLSRIMIDQMKRQI